MKKEYDVDDAETLRQLLAELALNACLDDTEAHYAAPHTKAAIHRLLIEPSLAIAVIPSAENTAPPSDVVA